MSEKRSIHRSSVEVFGVQPFGEGCVRITIEDDRGEEFAHVDANAEHCDALTAAMHTALGRPVPRETGWRDLKCGARVRFEDGEPVEVAMPVGCAFLDEKILMRVSIETGKALQMINGTVHRRPGDTRLRAMVCDADADARAQR